MNTRHLWSMTLLALAAHSAIAAVSADEARKLGSTLTATGAERAGNADKTIPEYTGGLTAPPAGYEKGSGVRPDPFGTDKPLYSIKADRHRQARSQADGRHQGDAEEVPGDDARGRLSDPPLDGLPEVRHRQHGQERHFGQDHRRRPGCRRHLCRHPVPDPQDRQRGDVEPPAALQRPELLRAVRLGQRRLGRQGGARHDRPGLCRLPVLRPQAHAACRARTTSTSAPRSPTPRRLVAPARHCWCRTTSTR